MNDARIRLESALMRKRVADLKVNAAFREYADALAHAHDGLFAGLLGRIERLQREQREAAQAVILAEALVARKGG